VWLTDANAIANPTLITLNGLTNFEFDGNGGEIRVTAPMASSFTMYALQLITCQDFTVRDFFGTQTYQTLDATRGTRWITCTNGCSRFLVTGSRLTGGLQAFAASRTLGSSDFRCTHFHVSGIYTHVYYGHSLEVTGDDSTFDIETIDAGRSYIGYNNRNVRGVVRSSPTACLNDVLITCFGNDLEQSETENIDIRYVTASQSGTAGSSMVSVSSQQAGTNVGFVNYPTRMQNINVFIDATISNTYDYAFTAGSQKLNGSGVAIAGDVAGSFMDVTVSGVIKGTLHNVGGGYSLRLGDTGNGISAANTTASFTLRDFRAPSITLAGIVGAGVVLRSFNFSMPSAVINREGGGSFIQNGLLLPSVAYASLPSQASAERTLIFVPDGNAGNPCLAQWHGFVVAENPTLQLPIRP
jgi:hypothetical protein